MVQFGPSAKGEKLDELDRYQKMGYERFYRIEMSLKWENSRSSGHFEPLDTEEGHTDFSDFKDLKKGLKEDLLAFLDCFVGNS